MNKKMFLPFLSLFLTLTLLSTFVCVYSQQKVYASGVSLYENNESGSDLDTFSGAVWKAQTFTPAVAHTVTSVRLELEKIGNPQGNIIVSIRATDANGAPTGTDLTSGSIPCSNLKNIASWYEFDMSSGYALQANTQYAICWSAPSGDNADEIGYIVNCKGVYASGSVFQSYSAGISNSWGVISNGTWDAVFEEWGTGIPPPR